MECLVCKNVSFCYAGGREDALKNIDLAVGQGEFVTVCGVSGSGKTTLLRLFKPAISPHGDLRGSVLFRGREIGSLDASEQAAKLGFVGQSPENRLVTDTVWHELAFGVESLGRPVDEIRTRVSETASFFGMETWFHRRVGELSGGEKQLLQLAAVMVMQPEVLLLDEPTGQLDPIAAGEFLRHVKKLCDECGTTVILSEHRLEEAFALSDRVIVMDGGRVIADGAPRETARVLKEAGHEMYAALPAPMRIFTALNKEPVSLPCPLTVREGRRFLEDYAGRHAVRPVPKERKKPISDAAVEMNDVWFRYEKKSSDVLKGLSLRVGRGELTAIIGGNGVGKSTLLSLMAGIRKPYRGDIRVNGKKKDGHAVGIALLPQEPGVLFTEMSVADDLRQMVTDDEAGRERVKKVCALCRLDRLLSMHPYDLSGGERTRAALAKVLLAEPEILLLDEPTKGLDAAFKAFFGGFLKSLTSSGVTVVMVSHDMEFCAAYADRCALVFDGVVTAGGTPETFFAGNRYYTTAVNRMARSVLPDAVLTEDVLKAFGVEIKKDTPPGPAEPLHRPPETRDDHAQTPRGTDKDSENKRRSPSKRTLLAAVLSLLAVVLTVYVGMRFFGGRKYLLISLLLVFETLVPFAAVFEARKPKAREIVLVSALCGLAVAGRAVFAMLPQFKPMAALIIVSGVCFGAETGFLVGSVSVFVSNFLLGQGPWTPWQMAAFGCIGLLAGLLFRSGRIRKNRLTLVFYGFLSVMLLYGGIMNPAYVLLSQPHPTWGMIAASYAAGLPFDMIHALSTAFFLFVLAEPMTKKLNRVKRKYGLLS